MSDGIARRDFLNGAALLIGAGLTPTLQAQQLHSAYYPPSKTGMRGSHDGAFEIARLSAYHKT